MVAGAVALGLTAVGGGGAWGWWHLRRAPMLRTVDEATEAAVSALPGFVPVDAAVSEDGRAALAIDAGGRVAVIKARHGRPRGRLVPWTALRQTAEGIEVETGDWRMGSLMLRGVDALSVRRLGMSRESDSNPD